MKVFECECGEQFIDIFDFLEHDGDSPHWAVRVSDQYSLNVYAFLKDLNQVLTRPLNERTRDKLYYMIQSLTLGLYSASIDKLDSLVEESIVQSEVADLDEQLRKLIREEKKDGPESS